MINKVHNVYFLGIGGIGMSALARWFNANGYQVAGYDRVSTKLTKELEGEGIAIHYHDSVEAISENFLDKENTLVVFTPAVPSDHKELGFFKEAGFDIRKRAEVLGMITNTMYTIAVAGTHGKTTTSSMVAHLLKTAGLDCAAFLGGITQNYNTNLLLNKGTEAYVVVEADEYDRSFLHLSPNVAIVTTMDADHLDIYKDEDDFKDTFISFVKKIESGGKLIYRNDLSLDRNWTGIDAVTFGYEGSATVKAENIRAENGKFLFDILTPETRIENVEMIVPGKHNILNALAAYSVGLHLGIKVDVILEALKTFKGVKRRFEYIFQSPSCIYIDDYAHHPTELEAGLGAVKMLYPDRKITLVFQPHLYSRTRDFMAGFAKSISMADKVFLLDIYPARELPIEGITSQALLEKITVDNKQLVSKEELLDILASTEHELLVTMGAGDIDSLVEPIYNLLSEKANVR